MPSEASYPFPSMPPAASGATSFLSIPQAVKCSICGLAAPSATPGPESSFSPRGRDHHGVILLADPPERICGTCVRSQNNTPVARGDYSMEDVSLVDLVIQEAREAEDGDGDEEALDQDVPYDPSMSAHQDARHSRTVRAIPRPLDIPSISPSASRQSVSRTHSQSLPARQARHWHYAPAAPSIPPVPESPTESGIWTKEDESVHPPNPLEDVTRARVSNKGRGALFPGSIFKGTQTSGRSAYEVEVKFIVSRRSTLVCSKLIHDRCVGRKF